MKSPFPHAYTHNHKVLDDGTVAFHCSQDKSIWPFLALPPLHPILVQTINFWASVESGMTLGTFDPKKWTALTRIDWTCGDPEAGPPVRGTYRNVTEGDNRHFELTFADADQNQVVALKGEGVVFRTRNFEGWREEAKEKLSETGPAEFNFAAPDEVGVETPGEVFLSKPAAGSPVKCLGLITKEAGLIPGHPYIGGSGDHVNSTHAGEIGRQFGELLLGRPSINTGGSIRFDHYVELGTPFEVKLVEHSEATGTFEARVEQAGRNCTQMTWRYA